MTVRAVMHCDAGLIEPWYGCVTSFEEVPGAGGGVRFQAQESGWRSGVVRERRSLRTVDLCPECRVRYADHLL